MLCASLAAPFLEVAGVDSINASANTLNGGVGADTLVGGAGNDTLVGGAGNDIYVVDSTSDVITEVTTTTTEIDTVQAAVSWTLGTNLENLTLTGTAAQGNGNGLANRLEGNASANTLNGGVGADTLVGGTGNDTYQVDNLGDLVSEVAGQGADKVIATIDYVMAGEVENLDLGSGASRGTGNALANQINGNTAANTLNGGAGNDTLVGGAGNDIYVVDSTSDVITEVTTTTTEIDTVQAAVSWTLGTNLENLTLTGTGAINGVGNGAANALNGNGAANRLEGGLGNDTLDGGIGNDNMVGGDGNDSYYVDNLNDLVSETSTIATTGGSDTVNSRLASYTLSANVENGRILNVGDANLTGNELNNVLYAGAGNNILNGATGTDTVSYYYGATGSLGVKVSLAASGAQITGGSGSDTLISVENLTGSNNNDTLTGSTGNNAIDGGAGVDTMTGADGSDTYYVRNIGDSVVETNTNATTGGTDHVHSYLTAYTLGANIENGRILNTGTANLTGNDLNNVLYAGVGNNILTGGIGTDSVSFYYGVTGSTGVTVVLNSGSATATGGSGTDTLTGIERLYGSNNNDSLTGDIYANYLSGYAGNDTLNGGDGVDTLLGGVGKDSLTGGNGNDIFDFNALSEMGITSTTWDVITDFKLGDKIDLSTLDANAVSTTTNEAFAYMGSAAFTAAGQLRYDATAKVLYGNTDANLTTAEFAIQLTGVSTLSATDFVL